jgi:hypothetical protein
MAMGGRRSKSFDKPDETIEFPGLIEQMVEIGDLTVARIVQQPGWRWFKDMRSVVEGELVTSLRSWSSGRGRARSADCARAPVTES